MQYQDGDWESWGQTPFPSYEANLISKEYSNNTSIS